MHYPKYAITHYQNDPSVCMHTQCSTTVNTQHPVHLCVFSKIIVIVYGVICPVFQESVPMCAIRIFTHEATAHTSHVFISLTVASSTSLLHAEHVTRFRNLHRRTKTVATESNKLQPNRSSQWHRTYKTYLLMFGFERVPS